VKEQGLEKLYHDIEGPLIGVLAAMEYEGIRIDAPFLDAYAVELEGRIREV